MPLAKSQNKENFSQKNIKKGKMIPFACHFFLFFMHKGTFYT